MSAQLDGQLALIPVINVPQRAIAGEHYLVTVDLESKAQATVWPYPKEEYAITCLLDAAPLFRVERLDDSELIVHRFGGTYGGVRFLLHATDTAMSGNVRLLLIAESGIPLHNIVIEDVQVALPTNQPDAFDARFIELNLRTTGGDEGAEAGSDLEQVGEEARSDADAAEPAGESAEANQTSDALDTGPVTDLGVFRSPRAPIVFVDIDESNLKRSFFAADLSVSTLNSDGDMSTVIPADAEQLSTPPMADATPRIVQMEQHPGGSVARMMSDGNLEFRFTGSDATQGATVEDAVSMRFDPTGRVLAVATESTGLLLFTTSTDAPLRTLEAPFQLHAIAWSEGGNLIACICAGQLLVFDVVDGREAYRFETRNQDPVDSNPVPSVFWPGSNAVVWPEPDGNLFRVDLDDIPVAKDRPQIDPAPSPIVALAVAPEGVSVAGLARDGSLVIWSRQGRLVYQSEPTETGSPTHEWSSAGLQFSQRGSLLATWGPPDGSARTYSLAYSDLLATGQTDEQGSTPGISDQERARRAQAVVNAVEWGNALPHYSNVQTEPLVVDKDASYSDLVVGRCWARFSDGTLSSLVERYLGAGSVVFETPLEPYRERLKGRDFSLIQDQLFRDLMRDVGQDPSMRDAQDHKHRELYFEPAQAIARDVGWASPFGLAAVYLDLVLTGGRLIGPDKQGFEPPPDATETEQLQTFVESLKRWDASFPAAATIERALAPLAESQNWNLDPPFRVGSVTIEREPPTRESTLLSTDQLMARASYYLGLQASQAGDDNRARTHYAQAMSRDPKIDLYPQALRGSFTIDVVYEDDVLFMLAPAIEVIESSGYSAKARPWRRDREVSDGNMHNWVDGPTLFFTGEHASMLVPPLAAALKDRLADFPAIGPLVVERSELVKRDGGSRYTAGHELWLCAPRAADTPTDTGDGWMELLRQTLNLVDREAPVRALMEAFEQARRHDGELVGVLVRGALGDEPGYLFERWSYEIRRQYDLKNLRLIRPLGNADPHAPRLMDRLRSGEWIGKLTQSARSDPPDTLLVVFELMADTLTGDEVEVLLQACSDTTRVASELWRERNVSTLIGISTTIDVPSESAANALDQLVFALRSMSDLSLLEVPPLEPVHERDIAEWAFNISKQELLARLEVMASPDDLIKFAFGSLLSNGETSMQQFVDGYRRYFEQARGRS